MPSTKKPVHGTGWSSVQYFPNLSPGSVQFVSVHATGLTVLGSGRIRELSLHSDFIYSPQW